MWSRSVGLHIIAGTSSCPKVLSHLLQRIVSPQASGIRPQYTQDNATGQIDLWLRDSNRPAPFSLSVHTNHKLSVPHRSIRFHRHCVS